MKNVTKKMVTVAALTGATIFAIAAAEFCGKPSDSSRFMTVATAPASSTPSVTPPTEPTKQQICEAYLCGSTLYRQYYKEEPEEDGMIYIRDEEGTAQEYYPGVVLPSNNWTVDEVVDVFRNHPEMWRKIEQPHGLAEGILYTPDYETMFLCEGGWIQYNQEGINNGCGVKIVPLNPETSSMNPYKLADKYQSGSWDGIALLRSKDYSTVVGIDSTGALAYEYLIETYNRGGDPIGIAYTGYKMTPCFRNFPKEIAVEEDVRYEYEDDVDENGLYDICIFATTKFYPDLPSSMMGDVVDSIRGRNEQSTIFLFKDGSIKEYSKGELLRSWSCDNVDDNSFLVQRSNLFVATKGAVYKLLKNGEKKAVTSGELVCVDYDGEGCFQAVTYKDGEVNLWAMYEGRKCIARNIVEVVCFQEYIWVTDEAGKTFVLISSQYEWGDDAEFAYLGDDSIESYIKMYKKAKKKARKEFRSAYYFEYYVDDFVSDCFPKRSSKKLA